MSTIIDERIVQMGFDNKNFESNVKTSMSTLDKLKNTLNFSGTASSLNKNLDSVDTSVLTKSLGKVTDGFSAMEIAAITAISRITNKVIDLGIQMVKSLSTDNIIAGWDKYGEKTTSVATLIAQGYDMDVVNKQLEKLNWFTDETSYTFTDMVSNISKFTASGQGLEESVQAMMGIANWAALSGQNATTASRAMYQLSQAMSSGTVKLADWKSIQNANMDTKEFREQVLAVAEAKGELEKIESVDGSVSWVTKDGNEFGINQFTEFLTSDGWFTSDVLMDVLGNYSKAVDEIYDKVENEDGIDTTSDAIAKYGDELDKFGLKAFLAAQEAKTFRDVIDSVKDAAASAWMNSFEHIFGGYDESKVLWTDLANELYGVFVDKLNFRNEILKQWGDLGGRSDLFANTEEETGAFWNLFNAIVQIKNLISSSWNIIFPFSQMEDEADQITDIAAKLKDLTSRLKDWTAGLILSDEAAEVFSNILQGIFSILKVFLKTITSVYKGIKPLIGLVKEVAGAILYLASRLGAIITNLVATTTVFDRLTNVISSGLTTVIDAIKGFDIIDKVKKSLLELSKIFKASGGTSDNYAKILEGSKAILEIVGRVILSLYSVIATYLFPVLLKLSAILGGTLGKMAGVLVNILAIIADAIVRFNEFTKTNDTFKKILVSIVEFIQSIPSRLSFLAPLLNLVKGLLVGIFNVLKVLPGAVLTLFKSISGSTVGEVFISIIEGLKKMFSTIVGTFKQFGTVDTGDIDDFTEDIDSKFSPLSILIQGITKLFEGLWSILKAVVPIIGQAFSYIGTILGQLGQKIGEAFSGEGSMFSISSLLDVAFWSALAVTIYKMVDVFFDIQDALNGIFGGFADVLDSKAMLQYAEALKTLAIGVLILVGALILLATIDESKLVTSLTTLGLLLTMLGGMMKVMSAMFSTTDKLGVAALINAKSMQIAAGAMMSIALAVGVLALSIKILGTLDQAQMINGIIGITSLLGVLLGASKIIAKNNSAFVKGTSGLIKMALAVWLLSMPVKKLGKMKPEQLKQGLLGVVALVSLVTMVAVVSGVIGKSNKVTKGLIQFAVAINLLIVPLKSIGKMKTKNLIQGLAGIAALAALMVSIGALGKYMKGSLVASMSMINIANSLLIASIPLRIIGGMGWAKLAVGMTGILGIATIFAALGALSKYMKNAIFVSGAMLVMGLALIPFSIALRNLGRMKWESLAKAGTAIVGFLTVLLAMSKLMGIGGAATLVVMSTGILILSTALIMFAASMLAIGSMKWSTIIKSLGTIITTMVALALVSKVLGFAIPFIMSFSLALAIFAASLIVIAVAISLMVTTLGIFGSMFVLTLFKVLEGIIKLAPMIFQAVGAMLAGMINALLIAVPSFLELVSKTIGGIIQIIIENAPNLIAALVLLIDTLLATLAANFPTIANNLVNMILSLLVVLKENIFKIVDIVIDVILEVLSAIQTRVPEIVATVLNVVFTLIDELTKQVVNLIPRLVTAAFDLIVGLIVGLGVAIEQNAGKIREAMISFGNSMWKAFKNFWGINSPSTKMKEIAGWLWEGLKQGLTNGVNAVVGVVKNVAGKIMDGFKNVFNGAKDIGKNVVDGISNGVKGSIDKVGDAAKSIGNKLLGGVKGILGIKSPSRAFMEIGKFVDMGLSSGIDSNAYLVTNAADELGDNLIDGVENSGIAGAIQRMYDSLSTDFDDNIVIRPVMDLSEIQNGANQIYGMMEDVDNYGIDGSYDNASKTQSSIRAAENARANNQMNKESVNTGINPQTTEVNNNTFNISGSDPKKIAEEVSSILQKQVDRRNQKWVP